MIDGKRHAITLKDMDVSMPIASMQRTIKCGKRDVTEEDGGTITNKLTGKQIMLHERQVSDFLPFARSCRSDTDLRVSTGTRVS